MLERRVHGAHVPGHEGAGAVAAHHEAVVGQRAQRPLHRAQAQARGLGDAVLRGDLVAFLPASVDDRSGEGIAKAQVLGRSVVRTAHQPIKGRYGVRARHQTYAGPSMSG